MIKFRKSNCRGFWGQWPNNEWFQECGKCKNKVSEKHLLFDAEADDNICMSCRGLPWNTNRDMLYKEFKNSEYTQEL
jgi:hypothetical protein